MSIKRALVVDDSKAAGLALRKMLEAHRVAVDLADSAEAAFTYLQGQKPDVIFMDHIMPGMNGLEAAKTIARNPQTATIPIVMYTSTEGAAYQEKAKAHGAVGVLPKPPKAHVLEHFMREIDGGRDRAATATPRVTPTPAPTPTMSTETIDIIARKAAESVVQNGVQSLVTRLVDEHLSRLRDELLARAEKVAVEAQHARVAELVDLLRKHVQDQLGSINRRLETSGPIAPAMLQEIKGMAQAAAADVAAATAAQAAEALRATLLENAQQAAATIARQVASDFSTSRLDARAAEVTSQVEDQLTALRGEMQDQLAAVSNQLAEQLGEVEARAAARPTIAPMLLDDIKSIAKTVVQEESAALAKRGAPSTPDIAAVTKAARDAAAQSAHDVAQRAALEVAERTAGDIARQVAADLCTARLDASADEIRRDVEAVRAQLAEATARPAEAPTLPRAAITEVKNLARAAAAQKAYETAHGAVQEVAQQVGRDIAKQATDAAVREMRGQLGLVYALAGGAALVGVVASLVVYFLH